MHFAFNDEQAALRDTARAFLEQVSPVERVIETMATHEGFDTSTWDRVREEMCWTALLVPEEFGGFGLSHVELAALNEEMGRALFCSPFFSSVCLGANALITAGTTAQKEHFLPAIATGEIRAALAHLEPGGSLGPDGIRTLARLEGDRVILSGTKTYVVDGHTAHLFVVVARREDTTGADGIEIYLVPADAPGVGRRPIPTMDQTRKLAEVTFEGVEVCADDRLGEAGKGWATLEHILDLAAVALAAEQVGGAERCLETAVEYAKVRHQFGRPIGSFQAIKHKCADMLLAVESARSAAYFAAWAAAEDPAALRLAAPQAQAYCSEAFFRCAAESIQVHGGIGFTWEHEAHLYFKRAHASEKLLGDPTHHRRIHAERMGL